MSQLTQSLSQYWNKIQGSLFSWLEEELDALTKKQQQLIYILELVRIEEFLPDCFGCVGRPQKTRAAIARSYIAKMVYNMDTTVLLIDRLKTDKNLRRICGWERATQIPSESTFSRAFDEFAQTKLPQEAHKVLIESTLADEVILHVSRDSTAIVSCYDLMDAAYDAPAIAEYSRSVGHVPLIDKNPRGDQQLKNEMEAENLARKTLNLKMPEDLRYNERTTAERANSRMKDDFGACKVRVRGHSKVACHLCFGVLVLAADQLMKLFG